MQKQVTSAPADLPDHLDLPLRTGRPHWYWIGGSPAVDLVNTLRERWNRRVECLVHGDDLVAWLVHAGLVAPDVVATARQVEDARALREAVDDLLVAAVEGRAARPGPVDTLDRALERWAPRPAVRLDDAGAPVLTSRGPLDGVDAALGTLALDAAAILGGPRRARLRICAAGDCSARFLDTSPAGRRRWCTMAGCGNRAKVRRHRARA